MAGVNIGKNNSKKISELKPRDIITTHKDHSWIPVSQYDARIASYTNFAINIKALTDYTDSYSYNISYNNTYELKNELNMEEWNDLLNVGYAYNPGYISPEMDEKYAYSSIAKNISTYTFSYTSYIYGWQYLYGKYSVNTDNIENVNFSELENYIVDSEGNKIELGD